MSTNVLSMAQARQITGGRKPLVPVEYETACNAIAQCVDIDEAKYWSDKSDALAAWAKIYHDDKVSNEARRLKLKAYRRLGELAMDIRGNKQKYEAVDRSGMCGGRGVLQKPGPKALLKEKGLTDHHASAAIHIARVPKEKFEKLVNKPKPPGPLTVRSHVDRKETSDAWDQVSCGWGLMAFRSWCRKNNASALAVGLTRSESELARAMVVEAQEWLDTFEQYLTNDDKK